MTSADAATSGNQDTFSSVLGPVGSKFSSSHSGDLEGKTGPSTLRSRMVATLGPGLWRTLLQSQVTSRFSSSLWNSDAVNTSDSAVSANKGGTTVATEHSGSVEGIMSVCLSTAPSSDVVP